MRTIDIGRYIKQVRETKGYSQRKLSLLSELSNTTISRIEAGLTIPDSKTLIQIANALKIPVGKLLETQESYEQKESDISEDLERLVGKINEAESLNFEGVMVSKEVLEPLLVAIEIGMEQVKRKIHQND